MNLDEQIKKLEKLAKKEKLQLPFEPVASLQNAIKPILTDEIEEQVQASMASIRGATIWKEWGFPSKNSVLMFTGPPGTGKTITARWIARCLRKPFLSVSAANFGSGDFGVSERNIEEIFQQGTEERAVLFFDECDAILWDRSKAGSDSMWMLAVINGIITNLEKYDGIAILATNHHEILDSALKRRITFEINFTAPHQKARQQLWRQKWPKWPLSLPLNEIQNLALAPLTGAEIETIIEEEARFAITEGRKPTIKSIKQRIKRIQEKD